MARENLYSRFVAWLKIVLPLAALAILSSVVFFARENEDLREIPFLTSGGPDTPGERIGSPEYLGVTGDGSQVILRAEEITRQAAGTDILVATELTGRVETGQGRVFQAAAPTGRINVPEDIAFLDGIVSVDTSDGFHVLTRDLTARLDITFAESGGAVRGEAPFGTLEAGGMRLSASEAGGNVLVFNGGVKLIYEPRN